MQPIQFDMSSGEYREMEENEKNKVTMKRRKEGGRKRRRKSMRTERWKGDAGRKDGRAVKAEERKGARDTKNARRKEERDEWDGGEARNVPGTWMRGEERKNGSTKGREENRGLAVAQTPVDTTTTTNYHLYHGEHEAGQSAKLGSSLANVPIHGGISSCFFFRTYNVPFFLFLSLPLSRHLAAYSSPDIFSPLALDEPPFWEETCSHLPSVGRFPHSDFSTYLLSSFRLCQASLAIVLILYDVI